MPLKILIADDYAAFRDFLKCFLAKMPETSIAGEARDGEEAVQLVGRLKPDLVLMDTEMPRMDGLEATRRIKTRSAPTKVVLLSALADEAQSKSAADCGADGFLPKGTTLREMITTLRTVATNRCEEWPVVGDQVLAEEDKVKWTSEPKP
jgi:DNA-binding NarL/FixJ family response regulator